MRLLGGGLAAVDGTAPAARRRGSRTRRAAPRALRGLPAAGHRGHSMTALAGLRRRFFAWAYNRAAPRMTQATLEYRRRLVADLEGRVLEAGCGPGNNFPLYPPALEVTAVDYSEHMLVPARTAARGAAA